MIKNMGGVISRSISIEKREKAEIVKLGSSQINIGIKSQVNLKKNLTENTESQTESTSEIQKTLDEVNQKLDFLNSQYKQFVEKHSTKKEDRETDTESNTCFKNDNKLDLELGHKSVSKEGLQILKRLDMLGHHKQILETKLKLIGEFGEPASKKSTQPLTNKEQENKLYTLLENIYESKKQVISAMDLIIEECKQKIEKVHKIGSGNGGLQTTQAACIEGSFLNEIGSQVDCLGRNIIEHAKEKLKEKEKQSHKKKRIPRRPEVKKVKSGRFVIPLVKTSKKGEADRFKIKNENVVEKKKKRRAVEYLKDDEDDAEIPIIMKANEGKKLKKISNRSKKIKKVEKNKTEPSTKQKQTNEIKKRATKRKKNLKELQQNKSKTTQKETIKAKRKKPQPKNKKTTKKNRNISPMKAAKKTPRNLSKSANKQPRRPKKKPEPKYFEQESMISLATDEMNSNFSSSSIKAVIEEINKNKNIDKLKEIDSNLGSLEQTRSAHKKKTSRNGKKIRNLKKKQAEKKTKQIKEKPLNEKTGKQKKRQRRISKRTKN